VRALSIEKISWVLGSPKLPNPPPPTTEQITATNVFSIKKRKKRKPQGKGPSPEKLRKHRQFFAFERYLARQ